MKDYLPKLVAGSCAGALLTLLAGSCAWSVGSNKHNEGACHVQPVQPTRGQELLDLKKARDQGALTEEEYQAQKRRLLGK
jgi:hypothetical protein